MYLLPLLPSTSHVWLEADTGLLGRSQDIYRGKSSNTVSIGTSIHTFPLIAYRLLPNVVRTGGQVTETGLLTIMQSLPVGSHDNLPIRRQRSEALSVLFDVWDRCH